MKNPNNVLIRTSKATDEELNQFIAWCEVCGAKGIYGDMHHCFEQDVICCMTEGCYSQIPKEEEAEEMREFTITGFHHVTAAGMIDFWKLLEEKGSIDLLWDMQPNTKTNTLMQSENFDLDAHIKTNYCDHSGKVYNYDDILVELHDEMVDAITALEFAFTTNQTNMFFNGRSIENLDCIPSAEVWNPNVYYPITAGHTFTNFDDFAEYCMNECANNEVFVTIATGEPIDEDGDGHLAQTFEWRVTGAADCNILGELIDTLISWGYKNNTYTLK